MTDEIPIEVYKRKLKAYSELLGQPTELEHALDQAGHDTLADWLLEQTQGDESLSSRIRRLEEATSVADGGAIPSTDWKRDRQVRHVRAAAYEKAQSAANGRAAYDVQDVAALFKYDISDGQCYKLLRIAAEYDEDEEVSHLDGFTFDKEDGDRQRVLVNSEAVRDDASFHAVRTPEEQEVVA